MVAKKDKANRTKIIIIVLAMVVLIILALILKDKILSQSNVEEIKQDCMLACVNDNAGDYCEIIRGVILDDETTIEGTCYQLARDYSSLGFAICEGIACGGEGMCLGNSERCNAFRTPEGCGDAESGQLGCVWDVDALPQCTETSVGCSGMDEEKCTAQGGCVWKAIG